MCLFLVLHSGTNFKLLVQLQMLKIKMSYINKRYFLENLSMDSAQSVGSAILAIMFERILRTFTTTQTEAQLRHKSQTKQSPDSRKPSTTHHSNQ